METSDSNYKKEGYAEKFAKEVERDVHQKIRDRYRGRRSGRVFSGFIVVIIGVLFLAHEMGAELPHWLFRWPMILIAIGIFLGAKHSFRAGGWIAMLCIGGAFLIDDMFPGLAFHQYIWPLLIIGVGLVMILRPRRRKKHDEYWKSWEKDLSASHDDPTASDDFIDSVSIFGGEKKNIISKDFKGGDIVILFGGMEINFTQADLTKPTTIEITQIFGGTKLLVPANWQVKSEVVTVFGSFEDKRPILKETPGDSKVLIIKGTCVFGAIDIKSY